MKTIDRFDVVIVPFPFTDRAATKRRPAVVLSTNDNFNQIAEHAVLAMITSATEHAWPMDVPITELSRAGLSVPCTVRMKLFTMDLRLILRKAGTLGDKDRAALGAAMHSLLPR